MSVPPGSNPVASPAALDSLVGTHITGEKPEVHWEDMHGLFRFDTEAEARAALGDIYYQLFLPQVSWDETIIREVRNFRHYSDDHSPVWAAVAATTLAHGPMQIEMRHGLWTCRFGENPPAVSRFPAVSICLAALLANGLWVDADVGRIEAELNRVLAPPGIDPEVG
jgi:hypothetical protein